MSTFCSIILQYINSISDYTCLNKSRYFPLLKSWWICSVEMVKIWRNQSLSLATKTRDVLILFNRKIWRYDRWSLWTVSQFYWSLNSNLSSIMEQWLWCFKFTMPCQRLVKKQDVPLRIFFTINYLHFIISYRKANK